MIVAISGCVAIACQLKEPSKDLKVSSVCFSTSFGIFGSIGILSTGRPDRYGVGLVIHVSER